MLRVWPDIHDYLLSTNNEFGAKFNITYYPSGLSSAPASNYYYNSSAFGLPNTAPYPMPFVFTQPGYYLISVRMWNVDPSTGDFLSEVTGYNAPPPPPVCITLYDNQLSQADVTITPSQPDYCIGDEVTITLNSPAAYNYISWQLNGITDITCFETEGLPSNPLSWCETYTVTLTDPGTYSITLLTSNPCQEDASLNINLLAIECCPPLSVPDVNTPFKLQCCMEAANFTLNPASAGITAFEGRPAYIVPASNTWSNTGNDFITNFGAPVGPAFLNVDLVIPSGVTLNISNMDIYFAHNCRILVQPNAHLLINQPAPGTTLIAGICNAMWQGIQVAGPGGSVARQQDPASGALNFGTVYMTGNVQVTDALFGIIGMKLPLLDINTVASELTDIAMFPGSTFFPSISSQILFTALNSTTAQSSSGGMLFVENGATLHNCLEGVNMSWHTAGCNLTLPNPTLPAYIGCQNRIQNANFTATQLLYPFNATGSPVNITEAGIHTIRYLPQANQPLLILGNSFNNLRYAARSIAIDHTSYRSNNIDNCEVGISIANLNFGTAIFDNLNVVTNRFNNCNISLQAARTRLLIDGNLINNNYTPPSLGSANPIGMFLQGSDFDLRYNQIQYTRCGIALLSNDTDPSVVHNNVLNACGIGVWTLGNNTGTQIACNQISNYAIAICAQDYTQPPAETGDLDDQGQCDVFAQKPADNLFQFPITYGSFTGYEIIAAIPAANNFIYWYRNQPGYIPQLFAGEVTPMACNPIGPTPLPSVEENCGTIPQPRPDEEIKALTDERLLNQEALRKVRYYLYEADDTLAALQLLEDINTDVSRRFLAPYYLFQANTTFTDSLLATLPDERTEDLHYHWLNTIYVTLRQSGRTITQLFPTEEDTIRIIAGTYTKAAFEARTLLYLLHGEEHPVLLPPMPAIIDPAMMQGVAVNFKNGQTNNIYGNKISKPYPNPTKEYLTFESALPDDQQVQLTIYNTIGCKALSQYCKGAGTWHIQINTLPPGLYYYIFTSNGELLQADKLIIIP
ncbi:T9SS C-terminal target domain-containing protein [Sphingobacteriales bacterium UPWRP_1]|nr:hypothetical protein BVG80_11950 [Sphingobacteriales bacterium TSM_CSM]PSJ77935.1 T9SS C-terminal target domain-containing protein [Sphingobacteriales bacterium UPWRP_1]